MPLWGKKLLCSLVCGRLVGMHFINITVPPLNHCVMRFPFSTLAQKCPHACHWKGFWWTKDPLRKHNCVWKYRTFLWNIYRKNITIWNGLSCCLLIRRPWENESMFFLFSSLPTMGPFNEFLWPCYLGLLCQTIKCDQWCLLDYGIFGIFNSAVLSHCVVNPMLYFSSVETF